MTQGMDQMLANYFGTAGAVAQPSAEDAEKVAQAEFFAKTAAAHGIDLEALNPAQIEWLWNRTFSKEAGATTGGGQQKVAEFPPPAGGGKSEEDEKKDRDEKARKEHEEKKAAAAAEAENFSQATYFGKTAAHAYVAEMKNIIAAGGLDFMKEASIKEHAGRAVGAVGKHLENTGKGVLKHIGRTGGAEQAMHPRTAKAIGAGAHAAGAGAAAVGVHHATKEKKGSAETSAFEMAAAELALSKIAAAEFDTEEAVQRLNAVLTLGLGESEKVASLVVNGTYEDTLELRALEYAAAAGYPVHWNNQ